MKKAPEGGRGIGEEPVSEKKTVYTMPLAELERRRDEALALVKKLAELMYGAPHLTSDDRTHSGGHWREGEAEALLPVLSVQEVIPGLFNSLAADDEGNDPKVFESALIEDRLQRAALIDPLATALTEVSQRVRDFSIDLGDKTRPVMLMAYRLAQPHAKHNPDVRNRIAKTIDFFAKLVRRKKEPEPPK